MLKLLTFFCVNAFLQLFAAQTLSPCIQQCVFDSGCEDECTQAMPCLPSCDLDNFPACLQSCGTFNETQLQKLTAFGFCALGCQPSESCAQIGTCGETIMTCDSSCADLFACQVQQQAGFGTSCDTNANANDLKMLDDFRTCLDGCPQDPICDFACRGHLELCALDNICMEAAACASNCNGDPECLDSCSISLDEEQYGVFQSLVQCRMDCMQASTAQPTVTQPSTTPTTPDAIKTTLPVNEENLLNCTAQQCRLEDETCEANEDCKQLKECVLTQVTLGLCGFLPGCADSCAENLNIEFPLEFENFGDCTLACLAGEDPSQDNEHIINFCLQEECTSEMKSCSENELCLPSLECWQQHAQEDCVSLDSCFEGCADSENTEEYTNLDMCLESCVVTNSLDDDDDQSGDDPDAPFICVVEQCLVALTCENCDEAFQCMLAGMLMGDSSCITPGSECFSNCATTSGADSELILQDFQIADTCIQKCTNGDITSLTEISNIECDDVNALEIKFGRELLCGYQTCSATMNTCIFEDGECACDADNLMSSSSTSTSTSTSTSMSTSQQEIDNSFICFATNCLPNIDCDGCEDIFKCVIAKTLQGDPLCLAFDLSCITTCAGQVGAEFGPFLSAFAEQTTCTDECTGGNLASLLDLNGIGCSDINALSLNYGRIEMCTARTCNETGSSCIVENNLCKCGAQIMTTTEPQTNSSTATTTTTTSPSDSTTTTTSPSDSTTATTTSPSDSTTTTTTSDSTTTTTTTKPDTTSNVPLTSSSETETEIATSTEATTATTTISIFTTTSSTIIHVTGSLTFNNADSDALTQEVGLMSNVLSSMANHPVDVTSVGGQQISARRESDVVVEYTGTANDKESADALAAKFDEIGSNANNPGGLLDQLEASYSGNGPNPFSSTTVDYSPAKVEDPNSSNGLTAGAIVGIVVGCLLVSCIVILIVCYVRDDPDRTEIDDFEEQKFGEVVDREFTNPAYESSYHFDETGKPAPYMSSSEA